MLESMILKENEPLAPLTTLGVGGPARWLAEAANEAEIAEAAAWAGRRAVLLFVLGGGSNLLISDAGFDGLVLHVRMRGIAVEDAESDRVYRVAAGEDWDAFVTRAISENSAGVECLAGIPGTVGGTPVQNVGAYGQEVASVIERVRAFDLESHEFVEFTARECGFSYRRSKFNSEVRGRFVVTRVDYRLRRGGPPTIAYPDLNRALSERRRAADDPTLAEVANAVRRIRQSKGMLLVEGDPDCRSAGSFFKNPVITADRFREIAARGAMPPSFPARPGTVKLPAAWLVEQAGFAKGYNLGRAGISTRHTLALVNHGCATAAEILALARLISARVEERFGIRLEIEPVLIGF
ncbi:MAG: UDP-N-acetylmuramate dehydrogenase [Terracidiphilus sp.]